MPHRTFISGVFIALVLISGFSARTAQDESRLVVAWMANSNLYIWETGDSAPQALATGSVIRPYISPDGQHIAYTRGDIGLSTSLWVTSANGGDEREIGSVFQLSPEATLYLAQVGWADNSTLYFNTLQQTTISAQPKNDLWRVNIDSGAVEQILAEGEGGSFSVSPTGEYIAIIYPGVYGEMSGRIRLLNTRTLEHADKLQFVGVSTGAEYPFYPEVTWESDGSALRVAIPHQDLVYDDVDSPPTVLWRVPVDGEAEQTGEVPASYFGQPRWSSDGSGVVYLQRVGDATSNQFALTVMNGDDPAVEYDSGEVGQIGRAMWIPGTNQFFYAKSGEIYIGAPGATSQLLGDQLFSLLFVDRTQYISATFTNDTVELRTAELGGTESTLIAAIQTNAFVYDARLLTPVS